MITTVIGIIVGFFLVCVLSLLILIKIAPEGYEDERGFHYSGKSKFKRIPQIPHSEAQRLKGSQTAILVEKDTV